MKPAAFALLLIALASDPGAGAAQLGTVVEIPRNQWAGIEFERFDRDKGTIWLRLKNHTAWPIRIPVEMSTPDATTMARHHEDGAEADVRYYLEPYDTTPWIQMTNRSGKK